MGSVDGRLLTDRWTEPYNGKSKGELMGIYAAIGRQLNTDAWMFGKNTLCEGYFPKKFHTQDTTPLAHPAPFIAERTSTRLFVVADPDADILYESATVRGDSIVCILPETAPAFLQAGLIDELSLVIYPGIDGSAGSTSIFHYIGKGNPSQGQSLELLSVKEMEDGVVWLRYKFHKNS